MSDEIPSITFPYTDQFLLAMLRARQHQAEALGLMGLAREVEEQRHAVRDWQVRHPSLRTPTPGSPGPEKECAAGCDYSVSGYHAKRGGKVLCDVE